MGRKRNVTEFDVLEEVVARMEAEGVTRSIMRLDVDVELIQTLDKRLGTTTSADEMYRLVDRCLANEWLEHTYLGARYSGLQLTSSGFGVVRSRRAKAKQLAERSLLKKCSDYVIDHKGLFIFLGAALALASLVLKLSGENLK